MDVYPAEAGPHRHPSRRRLRLVGAVLAAAAAGALAAVGAGAFTGTAGAMSSQTAIENINNPPVQIAYSSNGGDAGWTKLGTVSSLVPGEAYAVFANVQLRSNATAPAAAVCGLKITNEPVDYGTATFRPGGSHFATLSLEGLTLLRGVDYSAESGSATLSCHVTGPGTNDQVVAHGARIVAIPVANATSNLHTYGQL